MIIIEDINTHLSRSSHQERPSNRNLYFNNLLLDNNLISVNTLDWCRGADSTFVTYDGRHESLIDHIIVPVEKLHYVSYCEIKEDSALNVSRHRPVHFLIEIPACLSYIPDSQVESIKINWRKIGQDSTDAYVTELENNEVIRKQFFEDELDLQNSIDQAYGTLVNTITVAARNHFSG